MVLCALLKNAGRLEDCSDGSKAAAETIYQPLKFNKVEIMTITHYCVI